MITEILGSLGSWSITLAEDTPDAVFGQINYFGHIAVIDGRVDVERVGDNLLKSARYVGVTRQISKPVGARTIGGSGMAYWLGDEDGKGDLIEGNPNYFFTAAKLVDMLPSIIPTALTIGTVYPQPDPAARFAGKFNFTTRREILQTVCDAFGVEFRVNGDGTVDVGTQAQLYTTLPTTTKRAPLIRRVSSGSDLDTIAMPGDLGVDGLAYDYTSRIVLLGQTTPASGTGVTIATGSAEVASPYRNLKGLPVVSTRLISESGTDSGSVAQRAQLQLNRYNRTPTTLTVTAPEFEFEGNFRAGDDAYVYDPDSGIVDNTREVSFRGEILHPAIIRVTGTSWRVRTGSQTVAFRTQAGVWVDLTPFVTDESGTDSITVGDQPATLNKGGDSTIQVRVDAAAPSGKVPVAPTGLALSTSSGLNPNGQTVSTITAGYVAPTANSDGTVPVSLSGYAVQWRWTARAPQWQTTYTGDLSIDLPVSPALPYEVRVAGISQAGTLGAWSSIASITSAADAVAPPAPADPIVTSYLGQLRIEYTGTSSTGGPMPSDTNRIDVHVGTASGFTPTVDTRVSSLTPFARGVAYATAPYSTVNNRYVRLIAYDHTGNASAASAEVAGHTVQVADGDVSSMSVGKLTAGTMTADVVTAGRFATALTGARRELNAVGLQAWDASNNLTISLDGVNNLLTGLFKTALTGRRIEIGATGSIGQVNFFAPDGTQSLIQAYTSGSQEAIRVKVPITTGTVGGSWNAFSIDNGEGFFVETGLVDLIVGGDGPGASKGFIINYASNRGNGSTSPLYSPRLWINSTAIIAYNSSASLQALTIQDSGSEFVFPSVGSFRVSQFDTSGVQQAKFSILGDGGSPFVTGSYNFEWANSALQQATFIQSRDLSVSTELQLVHPVNAGGGAAYGMTMAYVASSTDGVTGAHVNFRDGVFSSYLPVWGGAYTNASKRESKQEIADFTGDPLAVVRSMRIRQYRRRPVTGFIGKHGAKGRKTVTGPDVNPIELGLIAEEAPAEIVTLDHDGVPAGINQYAYTTVVAHAVQQIADRLEALEKGKR